MLYMSQLEHRPLPCPWRRDDRDMQISSEQGISSTSWTQTRHLRKWLTLYVFAFAFAYVVTQRLTIVVFSASDEYIEAGSVDVVYSSLGHPHWCQPKCGKWLGIILSLSTQNGGELGASIRSLLAKLFNCRLDWSIVLQRDACHPSTRIATRKRMLCNVRDQSTLCTCLQHDFVNLVVIS
jgi:hypothetical protein